MDEPVSMNMEEEVAVVEGLSKGPGREEKEDAADTLEEEEEEEEDGNGAEVTEDEEAEKPSVGVPAKAENMGEGRLNETGAGLAVGEETPSRLCGRLRGMLAEDCAVRGGSPTSCRSDSGATSST